MGRGDRAGSGGRRKPGGTVLTYFSVCSGIEAASCAWEPLGWEPVGFSEIEPFPSAVLAHRFPNVKNYGDMTKYKEWKDVGQFDVLVGGTPCQSFSVAGLRKGLDDPRGNLMLTFGAIAGHFKPTWIVWENVPGVLSSNGGRDFGSFLGMLGKLGYGFAYRILDAQYFGVAQRRRRVFVVGYFGDWRRAAQVLFDATSLSGNPAPSREAGEGIAFNAQGSASQGLSAGEITPTLDKSKTPAVCFEPCIMSTGQGNAETTEGHAPTLNCNHEAPIIALQDIREMEKKQNGKGWNADGTAYIVDSMATQGVCIMAHTTGAGFWKEGAGTLRAREQDSHENLVIQSTVRRLTPREFERLQGFQDDWTKIPWRGKPAEECPDGPRYKACGNSMAVPVMRWIGERINQGELF